MGYLLPIPSIQSQQYANRMHMDFNKFAKIDRTEKVSGANNLLKHDFSGEQNHLDRYDDQEKEWIAIAPTSSLSDRLVASKTANLLPELAQTVGKGLIIDKYV